MPNRRRSVIARPLKPLESRAYRVLSHTHPRENTIHQAPGVFDDQGRLLLEWSEDWEPWQYYSAYCEDAFRVPDLTSIIQPRAGPSGRAQRVGEARALCTSELSDISPLTGGNVAFSTLDGRPGAYNFDHNNELQDWVSATDIRISLMRLNTFGDEVFGDQKVPT